MSVAAALALSTLIGLSLGLLGGGGSTLAVPVLVYVAGVEPHQAAAMSLAIVGVTSLIGGLAHARAGRVEVRAALVFGGAGLLGSPAGALLAPRVDGRLLLALFGLLMAVVGSLMLGQRQSPHEGRGPVRAFAVLGAGLGVGVLTGFLGVGGGFLIVPALVLFGHLPMHRAVGTSLLVIAANCASGLATHLAHTRLPVALTVAFTVLAVAGSLLGERLAPRVSAERLRRAFGAFIVALGALLVLDNARQLLG